MLTHAMRKKEAIKMIKEVCDLITDNKKGIGLFIGGLLAGTAGVSIFSSEDAKKVYTKATAAVLRGKEEVMTTATTIRENCEDIYADALDINEQRVAEKAAAATIIDDAEPAK